MPIDRAEVRRIARLAQLDLDEAAVTRLGGQLQSVLDYVTQLETLDVSGVEPTSHARLDARSPRFDRAVPGLTQEEALENAPDPAAGHFRVPRVLD